MEEFTLADTDTAITEKKPKAVKSSKTAASKRKTSTPKSSRAKKPSATIEISEQQRQGMIAEVAYYKAEQRGFSGGSPVDDWLAAEAEVDALLANNPAQQANA